MKIVTFSNCPLVESQGSGYVIVNFAKRLEARGHSVEKWGPDACEPLRFLRKGRSYRLALGIAFRALWRVLRNEYDVVEMYGGECWLATMLLSRLAGRRFLIVQHSNGLEPFSTARTIEHLGSDSIDGLPRKWYQRLIRVPVDRAFTEVDGLVTVSQCELEYALGRGYQPPERMVGIDNALPEEFLGLPLNLNREKRVTYCGSWLLKKGSRVIVADMTRILEEFADWRFRMIGVGSAFRKQAFFPAAVCERIDVVPFVTSKVELQALYAASAISIAPSVYESFGLVVAEAMSCGCAAITTRIGFAAALHSRGELLRMEGPGSPHLYACVKELIMNDELRRSIARAGHLRVQNLRWQESIDTVERTYLKWLQEFRSGERVPVPAAPENSLNPSLKS